MDTPGLPGSCTECRSVFAGAAGASWPACKAVRALPGQREAANVLLTDADGGSRCRRAPDVQPPLSAALSGLADLRGESQAAGPVRVAH